MSRPPIAPFYITIGVSLGLAQMGSYLVDDLLSLGESVKITGFFYLTHVRNFGGIFGFGQGMGWLFGVISTLVLLSVIYYVHRIDNLRKIERVCFGLIVGGGASNILDRLIYGSVVDFIDIRGIPMWTYIFNTADMMIHCGIWPIIALSLFPAKKDKQETERLKLDRDSTENALR